MCKVLLSEEKEDNIRPGRPSVIGAKLLRKDDTRK
jgi:hypothetical protein